MTLTVYDDLTRAGVSIWLDTLSRAILVNGDLRRHAERRNVVGVTSNPAIFEAALSDGSYYDSQVAQLRAAGVDTAGAAEVITVRDVQEACDQLLGVWRASTGRDGRVSLEVDPRAAADADAMTSQAIRLSHLVDRPNLMMKVPATDAGLAAITRATGEGISVNVTLIFSADRYAQVAQAYMDGLELALANGHSLAGIHCVASFFVSRIDTEVDRRLDGLQAAPAHLRGKAAVATAITAYEHFQNSVQSRRWLGLQRRGAQVQRLLWASTGVKDPAYSTTRYVTHLVAPNTVSTMPPATLEAVAQIATPIVDAVTPNFAWARSLLEEVTRAGVDLRDVAATLEREGVAKFVTAWDALLARLDRQLRD
jgi:transaldolase